jgi:hypothetical protein
MKHRQDPIDKDSTLAELDAVGARLARHLTGATEQLDPHIAQRLRAVREQAVDQHRWAVAQAANPVFADAHGSTQHSDGGHHSHRWQQLGGFGLLIALLLSLWMINTIQDDQEVMDAADVDRVLLTDDLPPAAYLDPGFKHFLKLSYPTSAR